MVSQVRNPFVVSAAVASVGLLGATGAGAAELEIGQPAPDFTAVDVNGAEVSLSDFAEETVVLEWTNHGCPYVQKHYDSGSMQASQTTATTEQDVVWLQISSTEPEHKDYLTAEETIAWNAEGGAAPTASILDEAGDIGHAYDARTTPHMYVIENGVLAYQGAIDDRPSARPASLDGATNYVLAALDDIATGEAVQTAETQPYGCSIKYADPGA